MNEVLQSAILDILSKTAVESVTLNTLSEQYDLFLQDKLYEQLIHLWRDGRIFTSDVELRSEGYTPKKSASWSASAISGFFGYDEQTGLFQVASDKAVPTRLELLATFNIGSPIYSIAVSPDSKSLIIGDYSGRIIICAFDRGVIERTIQAHEKRIWSLDYAPDGSFFVSGSQDGQAILWSRQGQARSQICALDDWVTSVSISPDGERLLTGHKVSNPQNPSIRQWRLGSQDKAESFFHHKKNVYSLCYLPDGQGFASGSSDNTVAYWSFDSQELVFQADKHTGTVSCVAAHPLANIIASGAWTGTVKLWEVDDGSVRRTIEGHNERVTSLAYSATGRLLASGGKDSRIAVWKIPEGSLVSGRPSHDGWVRALTFVNDDSTLASGGSDGICKIWKLRSPFKAKG